MLYSSGRLRPHVYPYFPLIMPVDQPFHVYREQLSSQYHGIALWNPNPVKRLYDCGHVSIGDVGYLCDGDFIRMFNVTLPWDDPSNQKLGKPEEYKTLDRGRFVNARDGEIPQTEYNSSHVSKVENAGNVHAETPDETKGQTYKCRTRSCGALLSLPHGGHREDVIHAKAFEYYIRDHVVDWFTWAQNNKLGVERMEDLILVTGCTLVTSWAAAAFDNYTKPVDATSISLHAQKFDCGGAQFLWSNVRGNVEYHNSQFDLNNEKREPLPRNQCVFIRGFRAKRTFFRTKYLRAAAEPLPDDPNNRQDDEIQATQVPDVLKYRDPLIGILDYIAEVRPPGHDCSFLMYSAIPKEMC
ncbi:hypothetical protein DFH94DRAFT_126318 [Russula ochroleuca]|uniref:Uncharacterized protein n=1 Tax=Russula ochroleuca TaxID=152965 RepID=A0A9P5K0U2_9AGAM|nr:hypothetical protein DFH94DRAFT_126318 [Russula ochroleuca]